MENGEQVLIPPQQTYEISFGEESIGAVADCNECSGVYEAGDSNLSITIACTDNVCASPTLSLQFKNALLSAEAYQRDAGELTIEHTLSGDDGGTLVFERAE
jgi:heat shock protein HslJ